MKTKELNDKEKENIIKQKRSENKIISLLGFAAKAGRACFGTDKICDEIRRHGSNDDYSRFISGIVIIRTGIITVIKNSLGSLILFAEVEVGIDLCAIREILYGDPAVQKSYS